MRVISYVLEGKTCIVYPYDRHDAAKDSTFIPFIAQALGFKRGVPANGTSNPNPL